jgi:hypothetical protein
MRGLRNFLLAACLSAVVLSGMPQATTGSPSPDLRACRPRRME